MARKRIRIPVAGLVALGVAGSAACQTAHAGVMMQGFYTNVPSSAGSYWWDRLAGHAHEWQAAGITAVWIPPVLKGAGGGYSTGYDPFDDYDIGSKNQKGTLPTHFGSREQLERMAATFRSNNLELYLDMVENHRAGDPGNDRYHFQYVDAYGHATGGRFDKHATDFHVDNAHPFPGLVPEDPDVPDPGFDSPSGGDPPFGPDLAPINSTTPNQYLANGLNDAGDWLTKALDAQGYRLDYVSGISFDWLKQFLGYGAMNNKFAVGEDFNGNVSAVETWINNMGGRASAFDFHTRFDLRDMCNGNGTFNMSLLDHDGDTGTDPYHSVTFVENHDTDGNDAITKNKALAYAYILTSEGYPCLFYRDYSTEAGCYGLKPVLDPLIWIHEKIAYGPTQERWKTGDIFCFERLGNIYGHDNLLVGMNDNPTTDYTITPATGFGANVLLHDYTGHGPDVTTDANGHVTITIPKDVNGAGYVAYARAGITGPAHPLAQQATTQEYAGASDLDIKPADANRNQVCRIWAAANKPITGEIYYNVDNWTADTSIHLELVDPTGATIGDATLTKDTTQGIQFTVTPTVTGFHSFYVQSFNAPGAALSPAVWPMFWLKATYTAPPTFIIEPINALKAAAGLASATSVQAQYAGGAVDLVEALRLLRQYNGLN